MLNKYFDINESGYSIRCKIYANDLKNIKKVIVFCHGFGGHKDNKAAERFAGFVCSKYKTTATIAFDWPCHGNDARKKLTLAECDAYLTIVLDYIRKTYQTEEIYAHCVSLGGYLVLKYLKDHGNPFTKIALRSPAINMYESMITNIMTEDDLTKVAKGKEALVGFDRKVKISQSFLDEIQAVDIKEIEFIDFAEEILILHGTKDEIIPFEVAEKFADDNIMELIPIEGADHRIQNPVRMDFAINQIVKFFDL